MPKTSATPRDELVCGKLDLLEAELAREGMHEATRLVGEIRYDCERMEAKLASRKAEVARLSPEGGGWRPIESAPKDGTAIQVFCPTWYRGGGGQDVVIWMNFTDRPGWYGSSVEAPLDPTHWMPLPAAPATEGATP